MQESARAPLALDPSRGVRLRDIVLETLRSSLSWTSGRTG